MKRKKHLSTLLVFMFLIASFWMSADESKSNPIAVSPGSDTEAASVWQSCPTFSWSAVEQALSYRIAVFEVVEPVVMGYEDMAAMSSPAILKDIPGPALSYTLSSEESLKTGSMYAWYVRAVDAFGNSLRNWSEGKIFKVEQEVRFAGIEEKLGEKLREYGVDEDTITNVLGDMKAEVKEVVVRDFGSTASATNTQGLSGAKGTEGANTYYGLGAGASNTTGYWDTFIGESAGTANTTGYQNTFVGASAGSYNTGGYSNTFIGMYAGVKNTGGYENTFLGHAAGYLNTSGDLNTFLGQSAGYSNTTGQGNLFLGYQAGYNETGSNKLFIDNSDTSSPLIYGEFDNDIVTVNGKLGIGTKTPGYMIEAYNEDANAAIVAKRSDGATNFMNATALYSQFGSVTNHPVRIVANSTWKMMINPDESLDMKNGASCTAGGVWTNACSRDLKENIHSLSTGEALDTLNKLNPVKYNYKVDKTDKHVGFIAEDVPELVATADRKSLSAMDITAVLTRVVQEQQKMIRGQQQVNREYKKIITDLQERLAKIETER